MDAHRIWQAAQGELQLQMTRATYDTWLKGTFAVSYEDGLLIVGTENPYAKEWLENRLLGTIKRTLAGILGHTVEVRFIAKAHQTRLSPLLLSVQDPEDPSGSEGYEGATRPPRGAATVEVRQFDPGDKVRHPQFGEGIVVSSKLVGDDEEVVVAFVGMKPKRLLVSFAQMEKLLPTRG